MPENKNTPSLLTCSVTKIRQMCQIFSTLFHTSVVRGSVELLTQQSRPVHAYREAKVLQPHTHCTDYNALQHPHIKRLKKRDLHCDAILCKCDARSPVKGHREQ